MITKRNMIDKNRLIEYVKSISKGDMVYQYGDGLVEVIEDGAKAEMVDIIENAESCKMVNLHEDDFYGFNDLKNWANAEDGLLLVDDVLLVCIAPCDIKRVA